MSKGEFTNQAAVLWGEISKAEQEEYLKNVICSNCPDMVEIVNFTGTKKNGDLALKGSCAICGNEVVRVLETSETWRENN